MYVTKDGDFLKTDKDFEAHQHLLTAVDVEYLTEDVAVLTTGFIQEFTDEIVKINNHPYNRKEHLFVSRPFFK
ncbi:hypothetical protein OJ967_12250 [Peribacillus frigoritolerans]|uniref:hypothetical protein n=1 Tax=Peribacillus frigoritolerans TaxID=450367 RepID=UPI002227FE4B|nr:hypothetical protein [Peribacillus frigoritolerans]UYZ01194.1 hypothetical protein OJ967_12250 [Peribacillus frigoritolerans]